MSAVLTEYKRRFRPEEERYPIRCPSERTLSPTIGQFVTQQIRFLDSISIVMIILYIYCILQCYQDDISSRVPAFVRLTRAEINWIFFPHIVSSCRTDICTTNALCVRSHTTIPHTVPSVTEKYLESLPRHIWRL